MNYAEIKHLIISYKSKVNLKLCNNDYAKGYCYGALALSKNINKETHDELAREIDDVFDAEEKQQTNADRIRSMTDEELAKFLQGVKYSGVYRDGDYPFQSEVWEEWLQEDSEV